MNGIRVNEIYRFSKDGENLDEGFSLIGIGIHLESHLVKMNVGDKLVLERLA